MSDFKTSIITDKLALLNYDIRQIYIHELKQAIKALKAESPIVQTKLLQAEVTYVEEMGEDLAGEVHGEIFDPKKRDELSIALLARNGVEWCMKHASKRAEDAKVCANAHNSRY